MCLTTPRVYVLLYKSTVICSIIIVVWLPFKEKKILFTVPIYTNHYFKIKKKHISTYDLQDKII